MECLLGPGLVMNLLESKCTSCESTISCVVMSWL